MNVHADTIKQLLETFSTSRKSLQARLTSWDETTALVGEQWIVCTPDAACAYTLTQIAPQGDSKKRYASKCCSIVNAPLYSKESGERVLKCQTENRGGQSLVLMHIRDALVTALSNVTEQEELARKALAKLESADTAEKADVVTWTGEQYLSSAPVDIDAVAESGSIMQWAIDECNFADSIIEGGAQALAAVAYKQLLEQDSGENEVLAPMLRQYEGFVKAKE